MPAELAACGLGEAGFRAHIAEAPHEVHFGGATLEYTTAAISLRNGTYDVDDVIPGGVGLTVDEIAVRVDPGTHILLRGDGLSFDQVVAGVVPWDTVTFDGGLGASSATPKGVDWRVRSDGSISISAPTEAGDWMIDLTSGWRSACLEGDGTAYGRIKVNG